MEDITALGTFLKTLLPVKKLCIIWLGACGKGSSGQISSWAANGQKMNSRDIEIIRNNYRQWIPLLKDDECISGAGLVQMAHLDETSTVLFGVRFEDTLNGIFLVEREYGSFEQDEIPVLHTLSELIGEIINAEISLQEQKFSNFVFNTMLDGLRAGIYVTDIKTNQILFMNQTMKEQYGIENPEGHICWQVLQKGMKGRCPFCPIRRLQEAEKKGTVIQWEETSTFNGRFYRNYDSLIRWTDGSDVHLQQSIDITELKSANKDELTQLLVRRPGKEALYETIGRARDKKEVLTVCLYDINLLKETNDQYGHAEGDQLIVTVAQGVQNQLRGYEYAFRLSGDEFIVVFDCGRKEAALRMNQVLAELKENNRKEYVPSFCFGLAEIQPDNPVTVENAIFLADEQMYEQKRKFHIDHNEQKRQRQMQENKEEFYYDTERLYDALVQSTDDYIYICNMKTGVFKYSKAMIEEFNLPSQIIKNAAAIWGARVHEEDRAAFLESNQIITDLRATSHCVEYRALNRRGEWVWVRCRGHLELDDNGEPIIFAGFITNLGKKNKIDNLTGLYNKLEMEERIQFLLETEAEPRFSVMLLGIDDLKNINDLYDRNFGDHIIRIVAQKIQTLLPESADIYRLDGDEFGIIFRKTDRKGIEKIYEQIHRTFSYQQEYNGKKYFSTLSAGCVSCPEDAQNYFTLIKYAGYSMEYAKQNGKKNCTYFSTDILDYRKKSLEMLEALRESMENNYSGFRLNFQPLVQATSGEIIGFEALARWENKNFGNVPPLEFIPLLESSGLIVQVGKWILETALHDCREWVEKNHNLEMEVNISYIQLESPNFVSFLKEKIIQEGFPPQNLVLEMTESVLAKESRRVHKIFDEIREMGVRIAMDDFGTGYSALGILKKSPVDLVKIDKLFMKDILTSNFDADFIKFIVTLCHDVGIKVCLEGVETMEEYGAVFPMGIDIIQGYYFDRPMEGADFYAKYVK